MTTEGDVTLAELVRQVARMGEQLDTVLTTLTTLGTTFLPREMHKADLDRLNDRQDYYQKQTDQMMLGQGNELQAMHRDLAAAEDRRHTDRIALGTVAVTALVAIVTAFIGAGWHP